MVGVFVDGVGKIVVDGTVAVYEYNAGAPLSPVVVADVYVAQSGGGAVNSVLSNASGVYEFWVDDLDYDGDQVFTVQFSKDFGIGGGTNVLTSYHFSVPGLSQKDVVEVLTNKVLTLPQINDVSGDHQYIFGVSELVADRVVTLPLLTGDVVFAFVDFAQTWSALQTFGQGMIRFGDTSDDHYYSLGVSELAANRVVTLPLLTGDDTFVFNDFAAVLQNKTLVTPVIASFANAGHVHDGTAAQGGYANGIVQGVSLQDGALATGTTTIPLDDSVPQSSEGDQYMQLAITPVDAANKLRVNVSFYGANSSASAAAIIVALFKDSDVGALATARTDKRAVANAAQEVHLNYEMVAGTTSEIVFKVRAGCNVAGTTTFNGQSGGRLFGGTMASGIWIDEIKG